MTESISAASLWPAKRRLARAVRELAHELCPSGAPREEIERAAAEVEAFVQRLRAAPRARQEPAEGAPGYHAMHDFRDRGPISGLSNPLSPPLQVETDPAAGTASGRVVFGNAYEGAPGCVHGGFVAAAFDEVLGVVSTFSGAPGMTGEFTIRYRRPTPINTPLRIEGRFDERRGRRILTSAEMFAGDLRTADCTGLFIAIDPAKFDQLARDRAERDGAAGGL